MYVLGKVLAVSGVLAFGRSSLVYHAFEHFFVVFVAVQLKDNIRSHTKLAI